MKFFTTFLLFIISFCSFSQEDKIRSLELKMQQLEAKNTDSYKIISDLRNQGILQNEKNKATMNAMNTDIIRALELQAQNERAMNLALDEFEKKFKEQNETFSFVQNQLDKKFNTQLILLSIFMIVFIAIVFVLTRSVGKNALTQNQANWNNFQEHILKK